MSTVTSSTAESLATRLSQIAAASRTGTDGFAAGGTAPVTSGETEDRFLKLLVAQMRNQDPLNPLDNAQVTSQLAQINTVRGIERLNESMAKLAAGSGISSPVAAIGLLGRQVLANGDRIERAGAGDGGVRAGFELPVGVDSARVEIVDAAGQVVFSKAYGATPAGMQVFEWNAPATAGTYTLRVGALSGGNAVNATTLAPARVLGVSQQGDGVRLELSGRPGISVSDIKAIL